MPPSFKDVNVSGTPGTINDRSQFYSEGEKLFVKKVHKLHYIHLENQSGSFHYKIQDRLLAFHFS